MEKNLINHINNGDKNNAYKTYHQIIDHLFEKSSGFKCHCRYLKNYLISLNAMIYINLMHCSICKKKLFCLRQNFMEEIEEKNSIRDIVLLGEKLVSFYINNIVMNKKITQNPVINDALCYIHNNLSEDLTLDKVSNFIHVSKNYLSYLFPKYTNYSFSHYVRVAKINRAKELLINTNLSLMEIALECGFNSQSYFCNVFKEFEGMTPKQYRDYQMISKQ